MKKKIMSLVLALVMCMGLTVPAFAIPVAPPEADVAGATDVNTPRYALERVPHSIYMQNSTYADIVFWIAYKGGTPSFDSCESISFTTTNPNGSHWEVMDYHYTLSSDKFQLFVTLLDVEGSVVSNLEEFHYTYTLTPSMFCLPLPAADEEYTAVIPGAMADRYAETVERALSAKDDGSVWLIPDLVSVEYTGKSEDGLPVVHGKGFELIPELVRVSYPEKLEKSINARTAG